MQKPPAKTIRLMEQDREAIALLRAYYGISSDNKAIRFALKMALRTLQQSTPFPNKERSFIPILKGRGFLGRLL